MRPGLYLNVALVVVLAGCNSPRKPVFGKVAVKQGTPISVTFRPNAETRGPACTVEVVNGEYRFTAANGPLPGEYKVQVNTAESSGIFIDKPGIPSPNGVDRSDSLPQNKVLPLPPSVLVTVPVSGPLELNLSPP